MSHLGMMILNIDFFLFITFNTQMVVWVIWQWLDLIWVSFLSFYFRFTDGCESHMSMILFNIGFFLFISFNSQMVVWVIWQWSDLICFFLFLLLIHRWLCELFVCDYIQQEAMENFVFPDECSILILAHCYDEIFE